MPWITLTPDNLRGAFYAAEVINLKLAAPTAAQLAAGAVDPLASYVVEITALVRGKVAGAKSNTLGPAGTIPDSLKRAACTIARNAILSDKHQALTDERKEEAKRMEKLLNDVADGTFGIQDAVSGAVAAPTPRMRGKFNPYDLRSQNGV